MRETRTCKPSHTHSRRRCARTADVILVSSITAKLGDAEGTEYWLLTAAKAVASTPYPRYDQNLALLNYLHQQCVNQGLLDAGVRVLTAMETVIVSMRRKDHPDLRCGVVAPSLGTRGNSRGARAGGVGRVALLGTSGDARHGDRRGAGRSR